MFARSFEAAFSRVARVTLWDNPIFAGTQPDAVLDGRALSGPEHPSSSLLPKFSATETDVASASLYSIGDKIVASKAMPYLRKECENVLKNFGLKFSFSKMNIFLLLFRQPDSISWTDRCRTLSCLSLMRFSLPPGDIQLLAKNKIQSSMAINRLTPQGLLRDRSFLIKSCLFLSGRAIFNTAPAIS